MPQQQYKRPGKFRLWMRKYYLPYLFISPFFILFLVFTVIPVFASLYLSFTDCNIRSLLDWSRLKMVGFENYKELFKDDIFIACLKNTFYFAFVNVPVILCLALTAGLVLNSQYMRIKGVFRTGYYIPSITTIVAVAVMFRWLYAYKFGLLYWLLSLVGINAPNFLVEPNWAMPAIIGLAVWKGTGINAIIYLAGLQSIPETFYDAAKIDGAGAVKVFRHITWPLLKPTTFYLLVMLTIGSLQLFEEPFMMTGGGPLNRTISVALYLYKQSFKFFNVGYGAAISYVLFLIILVITIVQYIYRPRVEY